MIEINQETLTYIVTCEGCGEKTSYKGLKGARNNSPLCIFCRRNPEVKQHPEGGWSVECPSCHKHRPIANRGAALCYARKKKVCKVCGGFKAGLKRAGAARF